VSLSRREVCKLGLTVAKRVEETIEGGAGKEEHKEAEKGDVETQMEELKSRLELLTQEFDKGSSSRHRSASTSDLLDDPPQGKKTESPSNQRARNHSYRPGDGHQVAQKQGSIESPNLDVHLKKSYTPTLKRQASDPHVSSQDIGRDWTIVDPSASMDSARLRAGTKNSKLMVEKGARKVGNKAKKAVEKSLSASGRFTHKLVKTAQALRRSSVSNSKRKQMVVSVTSASMDELVEEPSSLRRSASPAEPGPRKVTSMSEPPSPLPKPVTMPRSETGRLKKGTLSRKSVGSTNSLGRKSRRAKKTGGFLSASQPYADSTSTSALTESIYRLSNSAVPPSHGSSECWIIADVQ
jgi:hypothetical protein